MPDVNVTIDGQKVAVSAGTNIVDAARTASTAIPVFCYHPKLKPVGMCRMCLVEVYTPKMDPATRQPVIGADGKPELALMMNKLQPGCMTPVSEGMVVNTVSDRVKFAQKGQLEFLLTSHPLDCPVCDKGGECPLQNLTMEWGPGKSRFDYTDKVHFQKPIPLGDLIYLDRERCILCARCVRFQDEIAGDPVLGFNNRGRAWEIISKSEPAFDSKFSGNTTDICPVGALTSADFRFKARVWELRSVPSVCSHCSAGCNISLDMRHNELMRVMPRENDFVNEIWMCDKGRFGMRYFGNEERLKTPMIRRNNQWAQVSWDEALQFVTDKLTQIRSAAGASALGGLAGRKLPNEDLFLFQKLFHEVLGSNNIDHRSGTLDEPEAINDLIPTLGVGAGTNLLTLGKGTSVLVIGADPEEEASVYVLRLRGIVARGGELNVVNPFPTKLDRSATRALHPRAGTGATLVLAMLKILAEDRLLNAEFAAGRLRGVPELLQQLGKLSLEDAVAVTGIDEDQIRALANSFAKAENSIIIYGRTALSFGTALTQALANLALLTGKVGRANNGLIALLPDGNTRGALDMGVRPDAGPGGAAVAAGGMSAREMWSAALEGKLRGMYIAGVNPAKGNPTVAAALEQLEFLVVQDLFLTETAQLADVVLPAAAFAEREGTFTNAERRVQRFRQARRPEADLPPDWMIFQDVARAMQVATPAAPVIEVKRNMKSRTAPTASTNVAVLAAPATWDYVVSSDIADEISATVRGYQGTAYTSLELTRKSWGRQPNEAVYYDGTSYENTEGVGVQTPTIADDGRTVFPVLFQPPTPPIADEQYPLLLMTPTRAYDGGEWMRGSKLLNRLAPTHAILSMPDAQRLQVGMGEKVQMTSSAGTLELLATIDAGLKEGLVLVPDVQSADLAAIITGAQTRVAISKVE